MHLRSYQVTTELYMDAALATEVNKLGLAIDIHSALFALL